MDETGKTSAAEYGDASGRRYQAALAAWASWALRRLCGAAF